MANIALDAPASSPSDARLAAQPAQSCVRLTPRAAALTIIGFWTFYFVMNTVRMAAVGAQGQFDMLPRRLVVTLFGMALTGLLCLLLRRLEGRSMRRLVSVAFLASLPVSLGYALMNFTAFYVVHPQEAVLQELHKSMDQGKMSVWHVVVGSALDWYFFIVCWAVLYIALSYAAKVRFAERSAALYRAEAQSAQLRALRYQVNPHFLFNTLNSLSTLVMRSQSDEAERMIINLSNFFRTSLTTDPTEDVPLLDEIRMQRLYLDIEQVRFPDRLQVVVDIPAQLDGALVPGMILQPLIENAIKYGVARSIRPVTVTIRAGALQGRILISVEDDGIADSGPFVPQSQGHGVGLRNVSDRLAARFGADASCNYGARPGGGFGADLAMPLRMQPGA